MSSKARALFLGFAAGLLTGCALWSMPQGDVYFQDDFSSASSGWDRVQAADGVTDYADGAYRIFTATADYYMWATPGRNFPDDVLIEVDVTKKAGPNADVFGVLCRYQDAKNFYILMISGDGQAGIAKRSASADLVMLSGESLKTNPGIRPGLETNHLRADCIGIGLALYVNGLLVATAEDSEFTGGDAGLWLGAYDQPGTDLFFDNFLVRKPYPPSAFPVFSDADRANRRTVESTPSRAGKEPT
ncbi:MAG: hypothetical protein JW929_02275 [Anaerolineales bacterium]|nr:hypothetical protein [Anaerolineales bacterium]